MKFHPLLNANVFSCRFFLNLKLCMIKFKVLMQCFSYFTNNSNASENNKAIQFKDVYETNKHFNNFDICFHPFLFYLFEFICMIHSKSRLQNFNL